MKSFFQKDHLSKKNTSFYREVPGLSAFTSKDTTLLENYGLTSGFTVSKKLLFNIFTSKKEMMAFSNFELLNHVSIQPSKHLSKSD